MPDTDPDTPEETADDQRRVPRLRHDPARRRAAGGAEPLGRGQADDRAAASTGSAWATSRAAGRARTPRTPSSSAGPARSSTCEHATLAAFGATRRAGVTAADDPLVAALRDSGASRGHAGGEVARPARRARAAHHARGEPRDGRATPSRHLRAEGQRVFLDAEHFFDGYRDNRDYALEVLRTAYDAGAEVVALCDTNGGHAAAAGSPTSSTTCSTTTGVRVGIHCHNDTGCAVANTLAAVDAGATHVQGTLNGYGERTGNADLVSVVANLELKLGRAGAARRAGCARPPGSRTRSPTSRTSRRRRGSRTSASARSRTRPACTPARSRSTRTSTSTWSPSGVGNDMRLLVSDMAGRASASSSRARELGFDLARRPGAGHPGHRPGQGRWSRGATPSRPPTRRSSCCSSRRSRAPARRTSTSSRGG